MLLDLIKKRTSVRKFKDKEISKEIIDYIIEAGRLSPSGGNEQPWKFGIITDKKLISQIAEIAYNQSWIKDAPLLIVLCTKTVADEKGERIIQIKRFPEISKEIKDMDREIYYKLNSEEHQTKIPGTQMVLAALEKEVGSTWISYFEVDKIAKLLNISNEYIPSEIIAFGYPRGEKRIRSKKSKDEVVFYNNNF